VNPRSRLPLIDKVVANLVFADRWYDDGVLRTRCLDVTRYINSHGYPALPLGGKGASRIGAHRWAYEHWVGSIPENHDIDHLCHNADETCPGGASCPHRRCINPRHLQPALRRINVLRSNVAPSAVNARKTHCKNGHPYDAPNALYPSRNGRRVCRLCRQEEVRQYQQTEAFRERRAEYTSTDAYRQRQAAAARARRRRKQSG
jgi:hypothetical protein